VTRQRVYTGINIQFPISELILSGKKTIETRTYPLPARHIGSTLAIVETPGKSGTFRSRIVGLIEFGESFQYETEEQFYKDKAKHCVSPDSIWAWRRDKGKWGWPISRVTRLKQSLPLKKRPGIVYTRDLILPADY
jgi:hypothetical protein